jgi:HAMP domain-containing protein/tRNA A-37 threonylcarbamoyl transferase component Bud32
VSVTVGRYQIRESVGQGAMADVFKAYDPGINRELAVKVLKAEYRQNKQLVGRFVREAKAAGALSHQNIVTIFDVGEVEDYPYIAMELLDGVPLDVAIKSTRLPVDNVLAIGLQLASALNYAHSVGVVHRDIKPSNIMLARDLRSIKILDFGIARLADGDETHVAGEALKTQFGQVVGTPRYMSPEQALGQPVDGRSDLFSVGVVLYELITGRKPFSSDNATSLAVQIALSTPTPISEIAPHCPNGLRHIVNKLLDKRPERRFATGRELAEALAREQRLFAAAAREDRVRKRNLSLHGRLALAMASITALVLAISLYAVGQREYDAMERMAVTAGSSISSFVAHNVALFAVDNAARPTAERDWLPLEAFVRAAAQNSNVKDVTVVDAEGIVRASSDAALVGKPYVAHAETVVEEAGDLRVSAGHTPDGTSTLRFVRAITYAGRRFGTVDLRLSQADLDATGAMSLSLLIALGVLIVSVVVLVSYMAVRLIARPIQRLATAMRDAAAGDFDVRISHMRKDEVGELFDAFNGLADAVQSRLHKAQPPNDDDNAGEVNDLEKTRVAVLTPPPRLDRDETLADGLVRWVRRRIA